MTNLRIIADNAAERATLAASSASGLLAASNLINGKTSDVWRANSTAERLTMMWVTPESVSGVAIRGNFSPTLAMRVRVTTEVATTNRLIAPNDFTSASWVKTSITTATGVAGPDGTNSATTLTAAAASGELRQTVAVAAGNFASSIFIRRRTGSGAVSIRNAANTAWTALSLSSTWTRFANDGGTTGTSAYVDILLAVSGDAIDVCFAQLESGSVATSYYPGTRALGYIDSWQSYSYDSGSVLASPAAAIKLRGWTAAQSASAYAYGGGTFATVWLPSVMQPVGMAVDLIDTNNLQGYIEAPHLIVGAYWSPTYNTKTLTATDVDAATHTRTAAGDLVSHASTIHKKVPIEFEFMPATDRTMLANILRASRAYPVFLSVFPGNPDRELERDHTIYGKRMNDSNIEVQAAIMYGTKIEVESI